MSFVKSFVCAFLAAALFGDLFLTTGPLAQEPVVPPAAQSGENLPASSAGGAQVDADNRRKGAREEADLIAQQEMASAARLMTWLTAGQIVIAFLTIVLIWLTFKQTRQTAVAAVNAAKEAEVANLLARSISTQQLRAYISVVPLGIFQLTGSEQTLGQVAVRNVGKLPARNVFVSVQMKISMARETDFPVADDPAVVDRVIQPSAEMLQGSDSNETVASVSSPGKYVYVWGVVYYDDGYHKRRFTRFCHRYSTASYNREIDVFARPTESRRVIADGKARYHTEGNNAD